jgi:hypothetical protein
VGTGPSDGAGYLPLVHEQMAPLTLGAQQGFHVWVNVRARNVCFQKPTLRLVATFADTGETIHSGQQQAFDLRSPTDLMVAAEGWGELPLATPAFMCGIVMPYRPDGRRVEIVMTLTDAEGRMASDRRIVVPFCRTDRNEGLCRSQCGPGGVDGGAGDAMVVDGGAG